jgi:TatD DNase family protein
VNFYDAHCHYHDAWLTPHRARVFADLAAVGVRRAVVNGTCETDWADVAALAQEFPMVAPSYGLHPWDAGNRTPDWERNLLARLDADPRAFLGEIGLDRWILDRARPDDPRLAGLRRAPLAEQTDVFLRQLNLAAARNLPASIHCLEAFGPLLDALRRARLPARGFLLHAYSGSAESAKAFADLGAYFSFNGSFLPPVPYETLCHLLNDKSRPAAGAPRGGCHLIDDIRPGQLRRFKVFGQLPADRLLVETDAPAMRLPAIHEKFPPLPAADGSLANHPANLAATYAALAELRGVPLEVLAAQVEQNFQTFFRPGSHG